jgi:hypothetical protein
LGGRKSEFIAAQRFQVPTQIPAFRQNSRYDEPLNPFSCVLRTSFTASGRNGSLGVYQLSKSDTVKEFSMAKPHRGLKKANHGRRPANSKARRLKRKDLRT